MDTSNHYVRNGIIGTIAMGIGILIPIIFAFANNEAYAQTASSTPECSVTITPSSITQGDPAVLSWTSTSSAAVFFDQQIGTTTAASGSITVHPTSTLSYVGTFSGDGGVTTCSAVLSVTPSPTTANNLTDITGTTSAVIPIATPIIATTTTPTVSIPTAPTVYPGAGTTAAPMVVNIDASNTALIRGTVQFTSPTLMSINSWGGMWIIRFNGAGTVTPTPTDGTNTFSSINIGDFVGVQGTVAQDMFYTVDATYVRDWTTSPSTITTTPSDTSATDTGSATGSIPLYTGTVSSIGDTSFTITDSTTGASYTINTTGDTTLWNNDRQFIGFPDIRSGDIVRINGNLGADNTIDATVVRDTSL